MGTFSPRETKILNYKEIAHRYEIMKDPFLYNDLSEIRYKRLNDRCWKTLKLLMHKCLLKNEYEILYQGFMKNDPYKTCAAWT